MTLFGTPFWGRALAVGSVSAGAVALEVLLVRWFSIEYFHHFAYMAIGVAMLGYGASGTLAAVLRIGRTQAERWFWIAAVATPVTLIVAPIVVNRVALDPTQLAWDATQWPRLGVVYVLLAVPFGSAALATVLGLTVETERKGGLYGAGFVGSGLGAVLAVTMLNVLEPVRALGLPAVLTAAGVVLASGTRAGMRARVTGVGVLIISCLCMAWPAWRMNVSPYKSLAQIRNLPNARTVGSWSHPVGWLVAVEAPAFRDAPGLSLGYGGAFPRQTALLVDGDLAGAITRWDDPTTTDLLRWIPASMAYAIGGRGRTLVLGAGGTLDVAGALAFGVPAITAVDLHPDVVALARDALATSPWDDRSVNWVVGDARSYVAGARGSYDLVAVGAISGGVAVAGLQSLSEDFRHTEGAYASYLRQLTEDGLLSMTSWLEAPPRFAVRQILMVAAALRSLGLDDLSSTLVVAHSWGTATILARPSGFSKADIDTVRAWAATRSIDLDWYHGLEEPVSRFHFLPEPTLFEATAAAVAGPDSAARFAEAYPFDVTPAQDARPYPHHFMRAGSLGAFFRSGRGDWLPFAEWGYLALAATVVQSIVAAALLLLVPLVTRRGRRSTGPRLLLYFAGLGFGYMAAEIAAIQQLSLLLGHPVYAVTGVVGAFLVFSGLGSILSDRAPPRRAWSASAVVAALLTACAFTLLPLVHAVQGASLAVRVGAAVLLLAPLAGAMGFPFALGLRTLGGDASDGIAWAWAVNGFASVVAAPVAAVIAIEAGSHVVLAGAAAAYVLSAVAHSGRPRFGLSPAAAD